MTYAIFLYTRNRRVNSDHRLSFLPGYCVLIFVCNVTLNPAKTSHHFLGSPRAQTPTRRFNSKLSNHSTILSRSTFHTQNPAQCRQIYHSARYEYLRSVNNAFSNIAAASHRPAHSPPLHPKHLPRHHHGSAAATHWDRTGKLQELEFSIKWALRLECSKRRIKRRAQ